MSIKTPDRIYAEWLETKASEIHEKMVTENVTTLILEGITADLVQSYLVVTRNALFTGTPLLAMLETELEEQGIKLTRLHGDACLVTWDTANVSFSTVCPEGNHSDALAELSTEDLSALAKTFGDKLPAEAKRVRHAALTGEFHQNPELGSFDFPDHMLRALIRLYVNESEIAQLIELQNTYDLQCTILNVHPGNSVEDSERYISRLLDEAHARGITPTEDSVSFSSRADSKFPGELDVAPELPEDDSDLADELTQDVESCHNECPSCSDDVCPSRRADDEDFSDLDDSSTQH